MEYCQKCGRPFATTSMQCEHPACLAIPVGVLTYRQEIYGVRQRYQEQLDEKNAEIMWLKAALEWYERMAIDMKSADSDIQRRAMLEMLADNGQRARDALNGGKK